MGELVPPTEVLVAETERQELTFQAGAVITQEHIERVPDLYKREQGMSFGVLSLAAVEEGSLEVRQMAREVLVGFAYFMESEATRSDKVTLFEVAFSKWKSGKEGTALRTLTDRMYAYAGGSLPEHILRDDLTTERTDGEQSNPRLGTGTMVQVGETKDGNRFYFVESTVPTGRKDDAVRRLELVSGDYAGLMARLNEYSLKEYRAAAALLDTYGATPGEKKQILETANRVIAPTHVELKAMLQEVRTGEVPKPSFIERISRLGRLVRIPRPRTESDAPAQQPQAV